MRVGIFGDAPAVFSFDFDLECLCVKEVELDRRLKSSPSRLPSSSSVKLAKFSLSFFPSPVTELTALDAQPATLIILPVVSLFSFSFSAPLAVAPLSARFRDALEAGREDSLLPDRRCVALRRLAVPVDSSPLDSDSTTLDRLDLVDLLEWPESDLASSAARENVCVGPFPRGMSTGDNDDLLTNI